MTEHLCCFVSDSRVSPTEVVNQVARLVSSNDDRGGFHHLLGDADIDRFSDAEAEFYCLIYDIYIYMCMLSLKLSFNFHSCFPALSSK